MRRERCQGCILNHKGTKVFGPIADGIALVPSWFNKMPFEPHARLRVKFESFLPFRY
jgi:hypothetical protein